MENNKNLWKFFPEIKGKITGLSNTMVGLGGILYNQLANYYFNPDKIPAIHEGNEKFFPKEVSQNVKH